MSGYEYTKHASFMHHTRGIREEWVKETLEKPDFCETQEDGTTHYIKEIEEFGGRSLRVVVNMEADPKRILTLFFDRKLRGRL